MVPSDAAMQHGAVEDTGNWVRVGRGRELQFFATDEDVQDWLTEVPPSFTT